jgi:hypothetical protein
MFQRAVWLGAVVAVVISVAAMVAHYSQENLVMAADEKKAGDGQLAHMVFSRCGNRTRPIASGWSRLARSTSTGMPA